MLWDNFHREKAQKATKATKERRARGLVPRWFFDQTAGLGDESDDK